MKTVVDQLGRVMIPFAIRERMKIPAGCIVEFVESDEGLYIKRSSHENTLSKRWRYESDTPSVLEKLERIDD